MNNSNITMDEYQTRAMTTCLSSSENIVYMLTMINEEVGELNGKFSKAIRKGQIGIDGNNLKTCFHDYKDCAEWYNLTKKEVGDIMWGLAGLCKVMGWSLSEVANMNLDKLADRQKRAVIDGSGDKR